MLINHKLLFFLLTIIIYRIYITSKYSEWLYNEKTLINGSNLFLYYCNNVFNIKMMYTSISYSDLSNFRNNSISINKWNKLMIYQKLTPMIVPLRILVSTIWLPYNNIYFIIYECVTIPIFNYP